MKHNKRKISQARSMRKAKAGGRGTLASRRRSYCMVAFSRTNSTAQDPVFPGEKQYATKNTKGRKH